MGEEASVQQINDWVSFARRNVPVERKWLGKEKCLLHFGGLWVCGGELFSVAASLPILQLLLVELWGIFCWWSPLIITVFAEGEIFHSETERVDKKGISLELSNGLIRYKTLL